MATPVGPTLKDTVTVALGRFPSGATQDEIAVQLSPPPRPRDLTYLLAQMVEQGAIVTDDADEPHYRLSGSAVSVAASATVSPPTVASSGAPVARPAVSASVSPAASSQVTVSPANQSPPIGQPAGEAVAPLTQPAAVASVAATDNQGAAAASVTPNGAIDPRFSELFEALAYQLIAGVHTRVSSISLLQQSALQQFPALPQRRAFVAYAKARLETLTAKDAEEFGIEPEQYALWQKHYFPPKDGNAEKSDASVAKRSAVDAKSDERSGKRRGGSGTGGPATPKALAKSLTKWIDPFVPEAARPWVSVLLVTAGAALIAPMLGLVNGHPLLAIAVVLVIVGAALLVGVVLRRRQASATPTDAAEQLPDVAASEPATDAQRESPPQPSRRLVFGIIGAAVVLVAIIGVAAWSLSARLRPSDADVRAYLSTQVAPMHAQVASLTLTYAQPNAASCRVTYQAVVETTEPLYRRLDATEYLRTHAATELAAIDAAGALVGGPNGDRLRAAVPRVAPSPAVRDLVLLTVQTPPKATSLGTGTVLAWRRDGVWTFTNEAGGLDRVRFAGESVPPGPAVFVVDVPADAARLKALLADHVAYAGKIQATATALAAQLDHERQQRSDAFIPLLRPGTLFAGVTVNAARGESQGVVIELTECSAATHHVAALLRNDGGWSDARPYAGEWLLAPDGVTCELTLRTRGEDRVAGAGPLLDDRVDSTLVLRVRADGTVTASPGTWQLRRIDPEGAATVKEEFTRPQTQAIAATKAGLVYRGTAMEHAHATTESLVLRFTEQGSDGLLLRATLESPSLPGQIRPFNGTVVGNRYLAGSSPVRLRSADKDRLAQANANSVLGVNTHADSLVLALRVDGGRLVGADDRFTYEFELVDPATLPSSRLNASSMSAGGDSRDSALPPYPNAAGAYLLVGGRWVPLPRNHAHFAQSAAQSVTDRLGDLKRWEDKLAGNATDTSAVPMGAIVLDGRETVPATAGGEVVIVHIGPLSQPDPSKLERYPALENYPALELAALKSMANGAREAPVYAVVSRVYGFGSTRITAMLDQPSPTIALFRSQSPLARGHYALSCSIEAFEIYELQVE